MTFIGNANSTKLYHGRYSSEYWTHGASESAPCTQYFGHWVTASHIRAEMINRSGRPSLWHEDAEVTKHRVLGKLINLTASAFPIRQTCIRRPSLYKRSQTVTVLEKQGGRSLDLVVRPPPRTSALPVQIYSQACILHACW